LSVPVSVREQSAEAIVQILWAAGATEEEVEQVRRILDLWVKGAIDSEDVYYYVMGMAREKFIPLTPRQVEDIRESLGLARDWEL